MVVNDEVVSKEMDSHIAFSFIPKNEFYGVNRLVFQILKTTKLELYYEEKEESKLDISFEIAPHTHVSIFEYRSGEKLKIQTHYEIGEKSNLDICVFSDSISARCLTYIDLKEKNATVNYHLKTIARGEEKYDTIIRHLSPHTKSNIVSDGVSIQNGSLIFNVTSSVSKGMIGSVVNQQSRIIIMNDKECKVAPNLLIDEHDVEASHSAYIGPVSETEMFYLMSRGITPSTAEALLLEGFLIAGFNLCKKNKKLIQSSVKQYWR